MDIFALAGQNLVSPMVLSFALGLAAALARSDLVFPEAAAKALSIYLLFAIGFKGGVSVNESGLTPRLALTLVAGVALSAAIPLVAFALLRAISSLDRVDAAAVAAHYGSISIVTFVAATAAVGAAGLTYEGYMVAVAAAMEAPAILTALWLAGRRGTGGAGAAEAQTGGLLREILLNGSIVLLVGAFAIGWITGPAGRAEITSFIDAPFRGVLCLFLLDMGLVAGRGLRQSAGLLSGAVVGFGVAMPLVAGAMAAATGLALGLSPGGLAVLVTLAASASYIAVPAAMRVALPEANPAIYLTLSLGVTFPFNLTLGIPLYIAAARALAG
jgi:uncharacterized protein